MLATLPPGARKVRFNYPKIVKGEILISVYWKDAKGVHTEYMPLWSLQRDYAPELRQEREMRWHMKAHDITSRRKKDDIHDISCVAEGHDIL